MDSVSAQNGALPARSLAAARRLRTFVETRQGRARAALAFVAGAVSVLAFAPVFAWPVFFLTLPVFFWLLAASPSVRAAAWTGWTFGFGYFFFNLFWLGEAFLVEADKFAWLLPFAVTLLPAGMALFWALSAAATARVRLQGTLARLFVFVVALAFVEWLRGNVLTGLPWNVVGYALTGNLAMMQGAALVGVYGLTVFAILIFTAPLVLLARHHHGSAGRGIASALAVAVLPLVALWAYGQHRLATPQTNMPNVMLRLVQPSVPQREKWRPEHQRRIFEDHLSLSRTNPAGVRDDLAGITHVVWPEAAMPFFPLETPDALAAIADMLPDGRMLLTGAIRREAVPDPADAEARSRVHVMNGMLVFDDAGAPRAVYDKIHLVPFGEVLPFESLLTPLGLKKLTHGLASFTPGPIPRPILSVAGLPPVLGLICYEALFPGEIVQGAEKPGVIVNLTNDGWFGDTTGPRQHFHQTRVRAVEEGVPVVRVANNGMSSVIDAFGRTPQILGLNARGVIDSPLPQAAGPTLYARYRNSGFWLALAFLAIGAMIVRKPHA